MTLLPLSVSVLHVVSTTDRRGAERFAVDLASRLRSGDRPQSVVALTAGSSGGLGVPALGPGRFAPATLGALRDRIQGSSVVVAHGSSTLPAVAATAAGTGVPFVYRSIGDPRAWVTTRARRHRVGLAARRAAAVVALWPGSAVTWHEMLGVPAERLTIIPNAVDAGRFRPADPHERRDARAHLGLPADARVVACIGALAPEKRVDLAVEAVAAMDGVHLVVAGDGPCREAVSRRAAAVGHGRIHLLGHRSDPGSVLAAADVVVVPSATEGQPAVAVEAGLCGLPVVATRVGGLPSIVVDGSTGVLVAPGRADDLSRGISAALATGPTLGRAARDHCRARFDLAVVIPAWRRLLGDVVTSG